MASISVFFYEFLSLYFDSLLFLNTWICHSFFPIDPLYWSVVNWSLFLASIFLHKHSLNVSFLYSSLFMLKHQSNTKLPTWHSANLFLKFIDILLVNNNFPALFTGNVYKYRTVYVGYVRVLSVDCLSDHKKLPTSSLSYKTDFRHRYPYFLNSQNNFTP